MGILLFRVARVIDVEPALLALLHPGPTRRPDHIIVQHWFCFFACLYLPIENSAVPLR